MRESFEVMSEHPKLTVFLGLFLFAIIITVGDQIISYNWEKKRRNKNNPNI